MTKFHWSADDRSVDESLEAIADIIRMYPPDSIRIYVDLAETLGAKGTPEQIDAYMKCLVTHGAMFFKDGVTADVTPIAIAAGKSGRRDIVKHIFRTYPLDGEAVMQRALGAFSQEPVASLVSFCDLVVANLEYNPLGVVVTLLRARCSYEDIERIMPEAFELPARDLVMMAHIVMHAAEDPDGELLHACLSNVECSVENFGTPLTSTMYATGNACGNDAAREPLILSALMSRKTRVIEAVLSYCTQEVKSARYKDRTWTEHYLDVLSWATPDPRVVAMLTTSTKSAMD